MRISSGKWGGRRLSTVEGEGYRPAMGKVREALFSMLEAHGITWPGLRVLDLFAGSGSLAFEAASRGAQTICLVESSPKAVACLKANAAALETEPGSCRIEACKTEVFLRRGKDKPGESFGLIFIDPPYKIKALQATIKSVMRYNLLACPGMIAAEIENGDRFDPNGQDPNLQPIVDRSYGQTRIIIWKNMNSAKPYTPEPLTP